MVSIPVPDVPLQRLPRPDQEPQIFVRNFELFFQDDDQVVLVGVEHPGVSEVGLEPAPLALLEPPSHDHRELAAPVDAVDDVLDDGDADLEVPVVNAAAQPRGLGLEPRQQLLSHPLVAVL